MHPFGGLCEETGSENWNILKAIPQRRHLKREDAQPEIEVSAKPACFHLFLHVAVSCGDYPNADLTRTIFADPFKFSLLQDSEQFGL